MKIHLHLFTTAGVYLTASVINFDPTEVSCWSSTVYWVWVEQANRLACYVHVETQYCTSGMWRTLLWEWVESKILNGQGDRRKKKKKEVKFHTLFNLWLKNCSCNTMSPRQSRSLTRLILKMNLLPTLSRALCGTVSHVNLASFYCHDNLTTTPETCMPSITYVHGIHTHLLDFSEKVIFINMVLWTTGRFWSLEFWNRLCFCVAAILIDFAEGSEA